MPQFDFFSFFVQIFWLSFFSCIFYLIYLKLPLKNSSEVLKIRDKMKVGFSGLDKKVDTNFLYNNILNYILKK